MANTRMYQGPPVYKLWRSFEYEHAFIGLDPAEGSVSREWWHGGNSVLLLLREKDAGNAVYVYIGSEIFSFTPTDKIETYVSVMGNSAVPYPWARGEVNTYLMLENTFVPNTSITTSDPYDSFYAEKADPLTGPDSHGLCGKKSLKERL